jgi:hypothetical protein
VNEGQRITEQEVCTVASSVACCPFTPSDYVQGSPISLELLMGVHKVVVQKSGLERQLPVTSIRLTIHKRACEKGVTSTKSRPEAACH